MIYLRKGDKVTFEGVVDATFRDGRDVNVTNPDGHTVRFTAAALELVERPRPRLEELPDGTVIQRSDAECPIPYVVNQPGLLVSANGHGSRDGKSVVWPWKVIGACPGTPAWEPFMRGNAGWDADKTPDGEWWRSAFITPHE